VLWLVGDCSRLQMLNALPDLLGRDVTRGAFGLHNLPGEPLGEVSFRRR
jgi:hypothetical protein